MKIRTHNYGQRERAEKRDKKKADKTVIRLKFIASNWSLESIKRIWNIK